jgi:hypothetical protein
MLPPFCGGSACMAAMTKKTIACYIILHTNIATHEISDLNIYVRKRINPKVK